MRVWVTRAQPGAERTAAKLRALGHEAVVEPLLEVRPLSPALELDGIAALAFTSRNGVDGYARLSSRRDLPVFTVGDATAEAARAAGFTEVRSAGGDVRALAKRLGEEEVEGELLYVRPEEPATDLAALLAKPLRTVAVYETVESSPTPPQADAVLVHSPKAARALAALPVTHAMPVFCISENAAAPLRAAGFENLAVAPFPDEPALLKLLRDS